MSEPGTEMLYALTMEQIHEIATRCAEHAAGVFMRRHPDDPFPEKTIEVGVNKIIAEVLS